MLIDLWLIGIGVIMITYGIVWMMRNMHSNAAMVVTAIGVLLIMVSGAFAHDHKRPELNNWYKGLSAGGVPCCDGSDAVRLSDVDWESKDGKYRVRIYGQWVDVPDSAVIKGPNLDGQTMVWPYPQNGMGGTVSYRVRCFMPGSMT